MCEKEVRMASIMQQRKSHFLLSAITTLAFWQVRRTWFLLLFTTLGMTFAVILASAIPLLSDTMTMAGIRSTLRATPYSSDITLSIQTKGISSSVVHDIHDQFDTLFHQYLGNAITPTQASITNNDFTFLPPQSSSSLTMYGTSMRQAAPHLQVLQGQLASVNNTTTANGVSVMMTPDTAQRLHLNVGSVFHLLIQYIVIPPTTDITGSQPVQNSVEVAAYVAGLFSVLSTSAAYWQGEDFKIVRYAVEGAAPVSQYTLLVPDAALLALLDHLHSLNHVDAIHAVNYSGYGLTWHYALDASRLTPGSLDMFIDQLSQLQATIYGSYGDIQNNSSTNDLLPYPFLTHVDLSGQLLSSNSLQQFRSRIAVAQIPSGIFTLLILSLILFFVSLLATLLVERQSEAIAIVRSRGASGSQVFGALLLQSVIPGIVALVLGIPIAIAIVFLYAQRTLPSTVLDSLDTITHNPLQTITSILWYAVAVVLVAIFTMSISLFFAARMNVLSLRQEATRSSKRPLWQRLNLDIIAGVIALVGYGISLYITSVGAVLQGDAKVLIATPLSLIAPLFLILGCMFLFLRVFPLLLTLGTRLATRGRGAVSLLAIAQLARSPRQSLRMTMLLALAIAFVLFTLIYGATESEHIQEIVAYQTGADFSGQLSSAGPSPTSIINQYRSIPGVLAASVGYTDTGAGGAAGLSMEVRAVDAASFGSAVLWPSVDAYKTARPLLANLVSARQETATITVPAIIDSTTLHQLLLHVGSSFNVKLNNTYPSDMQCLIIGVLDSIPTINNRIAVSSGTGATTGGVLVDYQTYARAFAQEVKQDKNLVSPISSPTLNHVWLHTRDDATSLTGIRSALSSSKFRLSSLIDRRLLLVTLQTDPLYLILTSVLILGTATALLLAVIGNLLASWLRAYTRLTNFATLRAIGTTGRQVISILTWEQAIIYITGFLLGSLFGTFLALSMIPALTFTDVNSNLSDQQLFALQSALATQLVVPPTLPLVLLAVVGIFAVALLLMMRVVSQPALSQTLRLNED